MSVLRAIMLLALVVWVGGVIFFAFVMAPTLFVVLPSTRLAGDVVSAALSKLQWIGWICGVSFLVSSLIYNWRKHAQLRAFSAAHVFVVLMLALTAVSQFAITPRMRELRAAPQSLDSSANRAEFDRLHAWSTRCMGGVLVLGLGVVILTARRSN
jgi:uncharacterized membrane protein